MGWFWAVPTPEKDGSKSGPIDSKSRIVDNVTGIFWAPKAEIWGENTQKSVAPDEHVSACPIDHTKLNWSKGVKDKSLATKPAASSVQAARDTARAPKDEGPKTKEQDAKPSQCPVDHTKFNKLNNMPNLAPNKLPGQSIDLPTERTVSSIPRGEESQEGFWEYPSPQQMLNAMVRKSGREGIAEDAVESMVDVHNYLNEGVWDEVVQWEKPHTELSSVQPRLLKFQGRPGELSPRARMIQALGWAYPSRFGVPPPFDRHDWTVLRAVPGQQGEWKKVRYIIDFYEVPEKETEDDLPTFTVDVRPALDSFGSAYDRARNSLLPLFNKALGWS